MFKEFMPRILSARTAGIAIATMLVAPMTEASAEDITLRYSRFLPAGYVLEAKVIEPWIKDVERVTEGRVKVDVLPKVVGTVAGQYDAVADRLADIALFVPGYTPGRFTLIEGLELAFYGDDPAVRSPASQKMYEKYIAPTNLFGEVEVLGLITTNANQIHTVSAPPLTLDAFNGLKMRVNSPKANMATLLGMTPVVKPISETYELASGGTVDGTITPTETAVGYKLHELFKGITIIPGGLGVSMVVLAVNKDAWNSISEKDRAAIREISGEAIATTAGKEQKVVLEEAFEAFRAAGTKIETVSPEVEAEIKRILAPEEEAWLKLAKEEGVANPEAMLTELREEMGQ